MTGDAALRVVEQPAHVNITADLLVVDSDDDGIVAQEQKHMRSILEEAIRETPSTPLEDRPRLPRIRQVESGCREGSKSNVGDLYESQPGLLRDEINSFWRPTGSFPHYVRQALHGWTCYCTKLRHPSLEKKN
ncbi:unnamed protein product [Parnassius apollo]|uniref:(apollo) hypothetical protein n=1 Tax=Parnassius apollo TaxID=110799 RepID=A0A8S3XM74_PARAO|nr:unnamed protein product [Parnassius apollo]